MKTFPVPTAVSRVGRRGASLKLAPWTLGPFNGRFDDPEHKYRVRYVGVSRRGALVERLAKYRPDLDAIAAINDIEGASPVLVPSLPPEWLDENELATTAIDVPLDNGIVDLTTGDGIARAHAAIEVARRRTGRVLQDYDASVLMSAAPREFTQAISRYLFESGYSGVAYRSRFAPEEVCLALFEGRHSLHDETVTMIDHDDADLRAALGLHHLAFTSAAPASAAMPLSFRQQLHDLVYRMRALVAGGGRNRSDDDESDVILAFGMTGLADEVHDAKLRIRNFTGQQHPDMQMLTRIVPVTTEQLIQVASLLERLAGSVPPEARATPTAPHARND